MRVNEQGDINGAASQRSSVIKKRATANCYLERHFTHKNGSKDVVGDSEEDSFLGRERKAGPGGLAREGRPVYDSKSQTGKR